MSLDSRAHAPPALVPATSPSLKSFRTNPPPSPPTPYRDGDTLSNAAWHLILFNPHIPEHVLAPDGYDTLFSPPKPFTQRMWAGGSFDFNVAASSSSHPLASSESGNDGGEERPIRFNPLRVGQRVRQITRVDRVERKSGSRGNTLFVWLKKEVENEEGLALTELRCLAYMQHSNEPKTIRHIAAPTISDFHAEINPTPVMLFRYSSLTFNSHLIHYDTKYSQEVEGYPDCLVHGPLTSTFLIDLMNRNLPNPRARIHFYSYRALSPLVVSHQFTVHGKAITLDTPTESKVTKSRLYNLWASNNQGGLAMKGTAHIEESTGESTGESTLLEGILMVEEQRLRTVAPKMELAISGLVSAGFFYAYRWSQHSFNALQSAVPYPPPRSQSPSVDSSPTDVSDPSNPGAVAAAYSLRSQFEGEYVVITGVVSKAVGVNPILCGSSGDIEAVVYQHTVRRHFSKWSEFWNEWTKETSIVGQVFRAVPFAISSSPSSASTVTPSRAGAVVGAATRAAVATATPAVDVQVPTLQPVAIVPELSSLHSDLDLPTVSTRFVQSSPPSFGQVAMDIVHGERQVGIETIEKALPLGSSITAVGQLVFPDDPRTLSPSPSTTTTLVASTTTGPSPSASSISGNLLPTIVKPKPSSTTPTNLPYILTRRSFAELLEDRRSTIKFLWWLFVISSTVCGVLLGRRIWARLSAFMERRRIQKLKDAAKEKRRRRSVARMERRRDRTGNGRDNSGENGDTDEEKPDPATLPKSSTWQWLDWLPWLRFSNSRTAKPRKFDIFDEYDDEEDSDLCVVCLENERNEGYYEKD
ncbi:hypothetical protein HK102_001834 [Quaeritorhiza haematococci]|nr:hypothetical protein HK102_001834 [Quaeritorhiza haematococci]